jgi:hypothetical protein
VVNHGRPFRSWVHTICPSHLPVQVFEPEVNRWRGHNLDTTVESLCEPIAARQITRLEIAGYGTRTPTLTSVHLIRHARLPRIQALSPDKDEVVTVHDGVKTVV